MNKCALIRIGIIAKHYFDIREDFDVQEVPSCLTDPYLLQVPVYPHANPPDDNPSAKVEIETVELSTYIRDPKTKYSVLCGYAKKANVFLFKENP